jgi:putative hemin transport protein
MQLNDSTREKIKEAFNLDRSKMTVQLARELGVPEIHVIRSMPDGLSTELDISRWEELIRSFESLGNVHVIATNASVTLECFGQFGKFSTMGPFFNVQTKSLDMHIRHATLKAVFAVEKPGHMDGVNTISFQFFGSEGASAFKVFLTFGGKVPPQEKMAAFVEIRDRFALKEAVAV